MFAQAEAPLVTANVTSATATWKISNTGNLQYDAAYTFLYDLTVGQHAITAAYLGDADNLGSTSDAVTQVCWPEVSGLAVNQGAGEGQGQDLGKACPKLILLRTATPSVGVVHAALLRDRRFQPIGMRPALRPMARGLGSFLANELNTCV